MPARERRPPGKCRDAPCGRLWWMRLPCLAFQTCKGRRRPRGEDAREGKTPARERCPPGKDARQGNVETPLAGVCGGCAFHAPHFKRARGEDACEGRRLRGEDAREGKMPARERRPQGASLHCVFLVTEM